MARKATVRPGRSRICDTKVIVYMDIWISVLGARGGVRIGAPSHRITTSMEGYLPITELGVFNEASKPPSRSNEHGFHSLHTYYFNRYLLAHRAYVKSSYS